jgi:ribosome biogenesis GTPase
MQWIQQIDPEPGLLALGFSSFFEEQARRLGALVPARVVSVERGEFVLSTGSARKRAVLSGKLLDGPAASPCVGDFVLSLDTPEGDLTRIEHVLDRSSLFQRKSVDPSGRPQLIAANIDLALIERYLHAIADAPARALVLLNKADLCSDADRRVRELEATLGGVEVWPISAESGLGMERLEATIAASGTAVLVGSSGVGKSSLTNRLLDRNAQPVADVRSADTRGRHTTTRRELFVLPGGGVLIDTPGMREFGLVASEDPEQTEAVFSEIDALSQQCRFRDCQHRDEPGCAVRAAVARGEISAVRLEHVHKLHKELAWQRAQQSSADRRAERKRSRRRGRSARGGGDADDG